MVHVQSNDSILHIQDVSRFCSLLHYRLITILSLLLFDIRFCSGGVIPHIFKDDDVSMKNKSFLRIYLSTKSCHAQTLSTT